MLFCLHAFPHVTISWMASCSNANVTFSINDNTKTNCSNDGYVFVSTTRWPKRSGMTGPSSGQNRKRPIAGSKQAPDFIRMIMFETMSPVEHPLENEVIRHSETFQHYFDSRECLISSFWLIRSDSQAAVCMHETRGQIMSWPGLNQSETE